MTWYPERICLSWCFYLRKWNAKIPSTVQENVRTMVFQYIYTVLYVYYIMSMMCLVLSIFHMNVRTTGGVAVQGAPRSETGAAPWTAAW